MEDTRPSLGNTGVLLIMFYKVFCVVILKADLLKIFGSCHPTDPKNYLEGRNALFPLLASFETQVRLRHHFDSLILRSVFSWLARCALKTNRIRNLFPWWQNIKARRQMQSPRSCWDRWMREMAGYIQLAWRARFW